MDTPSASTARRWIRERNLYAPTGYAQQIVRVLIEQGKPMYNSEISRAAGLSSQVVGYWLRQLTDHGLISATPSCPQRLTWYEVTPAGRKCASVRTISDLVEEYSDPDAGDAEWQHALLEDLCTARNGLTEAITALSVGRPPIEITTGVQQVLTILTRAQEDTVRAYTVRADAGEILARVRGVLGWSVPQVATRLGVSTNWVYRTEREGPSMAFLRMFTAAYDVPLHIFLLAAVNTDEPEQSHGEPADLTPPGTPLRGSQ